MRYAPLFLFLFLVACGGEPPASTTEATGVPNPAFSTDDGHVHDGSATDVHPEQAVRRVTPSELETLAASGEAVIIDVRNLEQWEAGHIAGAIHIPYPLLFEKSVELPREKLIALYCT